MNTYTNQEIFNVVCAHLANQKTGSVLDGACLYRNPNGLKCAVGALIPDELYKKEMEGNDVYDLYNGFPEISKVIAEENLDLLKSLQGCHDARYNLVLLKTQLKLIATSYALDSGAVELITEWNFAEDNAVV